jgi:2-C-methyl-D-erythritol 4-phosphate cytidylyltransferase
MAFSKLSDIARKALPTKYCGAVIVAGGSASRMGGIDKVMAPLKDEPMIVHTVRAFQQCDAVREIIVVTRPDLSAAITQLCLDFSKVRQVVDGGSSRQESVEKGLYALSEQVQLVAVHDGARPLITPAVIDRTIRAAHLYGAAAPVVPVKDTIKVVAGGLICETPDRNTLRAVQTPQVFDLALLKGGLEKAKQEKIVLTDDCSAVEHIGMRVKIVEGDERNIKVTTPLDLKIAEVLMEEQP